MAEEPGATVPGICTIMAAPVLSMALGSAAISVGQPSEQMQARLQHLSAGVLVGAVITEIFPILKRRLFFEASSGEEGQVKWHSLLAAAAGFLAALVLMYSLKALDLGGEEEEEGEAGPASGEAQLVSTGAGSGEKTRLKIAFGRMQRHSNALLKLVEADDVDREALDEEIHGIDFLVDSARRLCRGAEPLDRISASQLRTTVNNLVADIEKLKQIETDRVPDLDRQLISAGRTLRQVHSQAERATFRRWGPKSLEWHAKEESSGEGPSLPLGLILAVVVDAVIDGMLIGLAGSVAESSGLLMALATAIEMGFLGYSFACSLMKSVRPLSAAFILAVPPVAMLAAAVAALAGASQLEHTAAFCGLVAFALVALLFLVVQELLVEAHEKEDSGAWHISIWLYVGLLLSISLDVVL